MRAAIKRSGLDPHDEGYGTETLAEFRLGASAIRDATTAWLVADGKLELAAATWTSPLVQQEPPMSDVHAAIWLRTLVTYPLRASPPHIVVEAADSQESLIGHQWESWPLYNLCILELFNHIVEHATFKQCPVCGRSFVRHRGRAGSAGQRRLAGVTFCSVGCNRINQQREYRRRQRTKEKT